MPHIVKLGKFPLKCLDNYSIIQFPEDAFFVFSDQVSNNSIFYNVDYPSYPKYFVDVSHFYIKKRSTTIKPDSYQIESKGLLEKFKNFVISNPKLKSIKIPVYHYYQYESNYQLIGFISFKVFGKNSELYKMQFKHYPLKFFQLNEIVTEYKKELPRMIEKVIESLPRYSHNFYVSILRMNNVTSLLKRRWKFMFGFSVKFMGNVE